MVESMCAWHVWVLAYRGADLSHHACKLELIFKQQFLLFFSQFSVLFCILLHYRMTSVSNGKISIGKRRKIGPMFHFSDPQYLWSSAYLLLKELIMQRLT